MNADRIPLWRRAFALAIGKVVLGALRLGMGSDAGPERIAETRRKTDRLMTVAKTGNRGDWVEDNGELRRAMVAMRADPGRCYPPGHTWPPGRPRGVGDSCQCGASVMDEAMRRALDDRCEP